MDEPPRKPNSIEEKFAALNSGLKQAAGMPTETPEQRVALLEMVESLRLDWHEWRGAPSDAPEWLKPVDAAVEKAFSGLHAELAPGAQVRLDPQLVQRHVEPVWTALTEGLRLNFVRKFAHQPAGAPPPKVDVADLAGMLVTLFVPPAKKK